MDTIAENETAAAPDAGAAAGLEQIATTRSVSNASNQSVRESIPPDSHSDEDKDVDAKDVPSDVWDVSIEKYGEGVVYKNACGESRLMTEFSTGTLAGMVLNDLAEVNVLKDKMGRLPWNRLLKIARASSRGDKKRSAIVDQILLLVKALKKESAEDETFAFKLMHDVTEKVYVLPRRIDAREARVTLLRQVIADKVRRPSACCRPTLPYTHIFRGTLHTSIRI